MHLFTMTKLALDDCLNHNDYVSLTGYLIQGCSHNAMTTLSSHKQASEKDPKSASYADTAKALFAPVSTEINAVKESLQAVVPPGSEVLAETVETSLTSGGKYMRPVVALLLGSATVATSDLNAELKKRHVEVASVAEMIHIATLLHDDVLDESDLRRGKPTIRAGFGNKISVLSGDYLLAQASLKLSKLGNTRLVAIYAQVLADLCDGEVEQMKSSYNVSAKTETAWESYYRKTMCKTASLFAAAGEASGVVNDLPEERIQALRSYGHNIGIAFQVVDDLLDYTSTEAEMGKPVFDDLRNGHVTAPVLLALESDTLNDTERADFTHEIETFFKAPSDEGVATLRAYFDKTGAIARTEALAKKYIDTAKAALDFVDQSEYKASLLGIADFILARKN